jgi:hypothetical protein
MVTTWDTYPLIYMGTIVLWLTIVCMSEGKKMKLAFHVVVENYCGNLATSSIILDAITCLAIGSIST